MNSLIYSTATRIIVPITLILAVIVLLRGHNDPGGGFIGGLLAALAVAILEKARGVDAARAWLRVEPLTIAGAGLVSAIVAGLWGAMEHGMFLTGVWPFYGPNAAGVNEGVPAGSILLFDLGVFLVVVGGVSGILFTLEEAGIPAEQPDDEEDS
jgi:multicomponent Na+:H+ antiporter subunit B